MPPSALKLCTFKSPAPLGLTHSPFQSIICRYRLSICIQYSIKSIQIKTFLCKNNSCRGRTRPRPEMRNIDCQAGSLAAAMRGNVCCHARDCHHCHLDFAPKPDIRLRRYWLRSDSRQLHCLNQALIFQA